MTWMVCLNVCEYEQYMTKDVWNFLLWNKPSINVGPWIVSCYRWEKFYSNFLLVFVSRHTCFLFFSPCRQRVYHLSLHYHSLDIFVHVQSRPSKLTTVTLNLNYPLILVVRYPRLQLSLHWIFLQPVTSHVVFGNESCPFLSLHDFYPFIRWILSPFGSSRSTNTFRSGSFILTHSDSYCFLTRHWLMGVTTPLSSRHYREKWN